MPQKKRWRVIDKYKKNWGPKCHFRCVLSYLCVICCLYIVFMLSLCRVYVVSMSSRSLRLIRTTRLKLSHHNMLVNCWYIFPSIVVISYVVSMSSLCRLYVISSSISSLCHLYVISMSSLALYYLYVISMSSLCCLYVISMLSLCYRYVVFMLSQC